MPALEGTAADSAGTAGSASGESASGESASDESAPGERERLLVVLNFSATEQSFAHPDRIDADEAKCVIGNFDATDATDATDGGDGRDGGDGPLPFGLRPYEARVYRLC